MYLLDKLKPFEQKEHFSLKEQNGSEWYLAYVCVGPVLKWDSNSGPPGWKPSTKPPILHNVSDHVAARSIQVTSMSDWAGNCLSERYGQ